MKVEIEIEASQMGETVVELFNSITAEEKKQIAIDIMSDFLKNPYKRGAEENREKALTDILENGTSWDKKTLSELGSRDEMLKHSLVTNKAEKMPNVKGQMIENVTDAVKKHLLEHVDIMVKSDPEVQEILKVTMEVIKKDLPKYMHDAMMAWFCSHMDMVASSASTALMQSTNAMNFASTVQQRLDQNIGGY